MKDPDLFFDDFENKVLNHLEYFFEKYNIPKAFLKSCHDQVVFRYLYNAYIEYEQQHGESIHEYTNSNNASETLEYKYIYRLYKHLQTNQEISFNVHNFAGKLQPPSLKQNNKNVVSEHQKLQIEVNEKMKYVFYKISEGKVGNTKNYPNGSCIEDFKKFDKAYNLIETKAPNYFNKCLQYYQLEITYRFETFYKLFKAAKFIRRTIPDLKNDIKLFRGFLGMRNEQNTHSMQNTLITDIDIWIDMYSKEPDSLEDLMGRKHFLNLIVHENVKLLNCIRIDDICTLVKCKNANNFFKNYIGEGQHITKNKDFEKDISIKYFRRIYS